MDLSVKDWNLAFETNASIFKRCNVGIWKNESKFQRVLA